MYEHAVKEIMDRGKSIRLVARETGLAKSSLQRRINAYRTDPECDLSTNYSHSLIFSPDEEQTLIEYIVRSSDMFYGLTPDMVRKLAYETAKFNNMKIPESWEKTKMAGDEWRKGFVKRSAVLSLRLPEKTSMARASAFNKHNIDQFFNCFSKCLNQQEPQLSVCGT